MRYCICATWEKDGKIKEGILSVDKHGFNNFEIGKIGTQFFAFDLETAKAVLKIEKEELKQCNVEVKGVYIKKIDSFNFGYKFKKAVNCKVHSKIMATIKNEILEITEERQSGNFSVKDIDCKISSTNNLESLISSL